MIDLKTHLEHRVAAALGDLDPAQRDALSLMPPKNREHGDIALGCFQLAKLRKAAPPQVAAELAAAFEPDDLIESAEAAGPFVNFRYRRAALAQSIVESVLRDAAPFGRAAATDTSIVIDFSSPNIAKPFHMGHLRSTVIGAALCRIHRHLGATVHGVNHLGDWGMPFAKMMTAYMKWGERDKLDANPMRYMFDLYVRYGKAAKEDPSLDEEAAQHFKALESGEENAEREMWRFLRDESLKAFQGPYDRLGVTFDHVTGESFYEDKMQPVLERYEKAGVLVESDGADVVDLKEFGIKVPCILRKSDGTTLYHTRDLAAVFYREQEFDPTRILYVVGAEQKLHFQQLVAVLEKIGDPIAKRVEHVPFGLILALNEETGKWEKFASRGGNAIFLDEVLDEAVAGVRKIIAEKNPDLADADRVAEKVGVGAIVFNDLKNGRVKDVKFDWSAMLAFEGETGPYVQYAGARLASILRKSDAPEDPDALLEGVDWKLLEDAAPVLLTMQEFGPAVVRAAKESEPSVITNLMLRIAGEIHSYLREHHVLRAEPELRNARLALVAAAKRVLATGLGLIGVAAVDEM
ncbi:MAG: arginine--tRNA ligase [Planctomycetes bacterium]|nr:arginine--tRNA ligase [Planctomycetota bacterium]